MEDLTSSKSLSDTHHVGVCELPQPTCIRKKLSDLDEVLALERRAFQDPWTRAQFTEELDNPAPQSSYSERTALCAAISCSGS